MSCRRDLALLVSILTILACGEGDGNQGPSTSAGVGAAGATGGAPAVGGGGNGAATTGGSADGGGGGGEPRSCARTCAVPGDCPKPTANPPFDGNNWACDAGLCRWLGCLDDTECEFFNGVCRPGGPVTGPVNACTEACSDVAECAENLEAVDLDNWSCDRGACEYTGCLSDAECSVDLGAGAKCVASPGRPATCSSPCAAPADCVSEGASAVHDEDNWACAEGVCVYTGCNSNDECTAAEGMPASCVP